MKKTSVGILGLFHQAGCACGRDDEILRVTGTGQFKRVERDRMLQELKTENANGRNYKTFRLSVIPHIVCKKKLSYSVRTYARLINVQSILVYILWIFQPVS